MKSPITDPQIVKDLMMMSYRYSPNEFRLLLHLVNKAYFQVLGNHSELGEAMQKLIDLRHTLASERVFSGTINKSNQGVIPRRSASRELYNR
ncbi:hypothetical protein HGA88_06435 [Candidatus Roizmanbacteria bacterium]|nr:hypothetical protein [Candidatus Roizmanbacteria bacterium]